MFKNKPISIELDDCAQRFGLRLSAWQDADQRTRERKQ